MWKMNDFQDKFYHIINFNVCKQGLKNFVKYDHFNERKPSLFVDYFLKYGKIKKLLLFYASSYGFFIVKIYFLCRYLCFN